MNLPILGQLSNNESTYIIFSKALLDLDEAIVNDTEYYFSKVVALNLPHWKNPDFYYNMSNLGTIRSDKPNKVIPKIFQHYLENILRQNSSNNDKYVEEITELAFWKTLNKMGISYDKIPSMITFCNDIITSNFTRTENNNGWGEIICQIPNKCQLFTPHFREVKNIKNIILTDVTERQVTDEEQLPIYDNNEYQYLFDSLEKRQVIDMDNLQYDSVTQSSFDFNVLLLFYRDKAGVDKLHGINFIYPFEDKVTYHDIVTFTQKTNITQTIGYQFIFNLKTCNNEASLTKVYEQYEHVMWWNGFEKTLSGLNSFLEDKMRRDYISTNN